MVWLMAYAARTDNLLNPVVGDVELFNKLKACMKDNLTNNSVGCANTYQSAYDPLPCSPFSPEWKMLGNDVIRGLLRKMFVRAGYGRGKSDKKLGVGQAPVGWPEEIEWNNYRGSTRSGLKVSQVTQIIVSMLRAAGFNGDTHVKETEKAIAVEGAAEEGTTDEGLTADRMTGEAAAREVAPRKIAAIEDAREIDVIIGEHIVDVVTVSGSIVTNRQNAIIGIASYDSQHQNDDKVPAVKMGNNLLSMQKELVPELLADMKAGEDRSQVVDSAILGKQMGVKRNFGS